MTSCWPFLLLALAAVAFSPARATALSDAEAKAVITVADLSREAVIDPGEIASDGAVGVRSPDGLWIAFVVQKGDPDTGANVGELYVLSAASLAASSPRLLLAMRSVGPASPMTSLKWSPDSRSLLFLGARGEEPARVWRADVQTGRLEQLTENTTSITWFDVTPDLSRIVEVDEQLPHKLEDDLSCKHGGCRIEAQTIYNAESGISSISWPLIARDLRTHRVRLIPPPEASDPDLDTCHDDLSGGVSPDGHFGLRYCRRKAGHWPAWWAEYTTSPNLRATMAAGSTSFTRQWILMDLERGTSRRLTEAPYLAIDNPQIAPIWIDGGLKLLLVGASEPLVGVDDAERAIRADRYVVMQFDLQTGATSTIAALPGAARRILSARWDEATQTLRVATADAANHPISETNLRRVDGKWAPAEPSDPRREQPMLRLEFEQGLNEPPVLVARAGTRTRRILPLDPWLETRLLGRVEAVSWSAKDGRTWTGGLYFPPDYQPSRRYAAVIQTHGFNPKVFSLTGLNANFNAQVLAARGMFVLQVAENAPADGGPKEFEAAQAGYEAAIDMLDSRGLVDRSRIGIQGWSRTGPYVGYLITHSPFPVSAVAFTDTTDFGWWYYVAQGGQHGESEYGTPPFSEGLEVWRKMSPTFNLDRVHSPVLMWSASSLVGLWDWYAILRHLGKPVEYWYLPEGAHVVFEVPQRLHMSQLLVDWFDFWLNGREDPDVAKTEQYERWRTMRASGVTVTTQYLAPSHWVVRQ